MKWFEEELNTAIAQQEMMEAQQGYYEEGIRIMQMELGEAEVQEPEPEEEGCRHENNETIELPFCDETITICHDCGYEI